MKIRKQILFVIYAKTLTIFLKEKIRPKFVEDAMKYLKDGLNEVFTAYLVGRLGDWWLFPGFASVGSLTTYRKKRP